MTIIDKLIAVSIVMYIISSILILYASNEKCKISSKKNNGYNFSWRPFFAFYYTYVVNDEYHKIIILNKLLIDFWKNDFSLKFLRKKNLYFKLVLKK